MNHYANETAWIYIKYSLTLFLGHFFEFTIDFYFSASRLILYTKVYSNDALHNSKRRTKCFDAKSN